MTPQERKQRKAEKQRQIERLEAAHAEARRVVQSGKCPQCGSPVRRNLALTGWWQCSQYGAEGFRADSSKPSCSWQGFTE